MSSLLRSRSLKHLNLRLRCRLAIPHEISPRYLTGYTFRMTLTQKIALAVLVLLVLGAATYVLMRPQSSANADAVQTNIR